MGLAVACVGFTVAHVYFTAACVGFAIARRVGVTSTMWFLLWLVMGFIVVRRVVTVPWVALCLMRIFTVARLCFAVAHVCFTVAHVWVLLWLVWILLWLM